MSSGRIRQLDPAAASVAVLLLVAAGVIFRDASRLALAATYGVGPAAMPMIVAGGLAVLAIANLLAGSGGAAPSRESLDVRAIILILGGLVAVISLIGLGGGFIAATAILFATTAAAFGRRAFFADLVIGFVLGLFIFLMFDKLLTLGLPAGPLERLI